MVRSAKISILNSTKHKLSIVSSILEAYRAAVNFYIKLLWVTPGKLDAKTAALLPSTNTRLTLSYKNQALRQALGIVIKTKKSARSTKNFASTPVFRGGASLSSSFFLVQEGRGTFDLVIKLSTLRHCKRIILPCRKTKVLNRLLSYKGAKVKGCILLESEIILLVTVPQLKLKSSGKVIGIDLGVNKLLALSDGKHPKFLGTNFKNVIDKILRKQSRSLGKLRALRERDNYVNWALGRIAWDKIKVLGIENLKGVKRTKNTNNRKKFRKAMAHWNVRWVVERLAKKAEENRVYLIKVSAAYTSRTCPVCSRCQKENRKGEKFCCLGCGYTADADFVGATNVLNRTLATLGSIKSPRPTI
jgi:IS605 OrfB family transposase